MKYLFTLIALGLSLNSAASVSPTTGSEAQLYHFKFRLKGETFEIAQKTKTYEEAYELAAKACYRHYKAGQPLTEERGLDIIDVCANPRS